MKKLKWLAVIVVALIAVVVLGACDLFGSGTNNGTNNNGGTNNGTNNNDGTNNGTNNNGEENTVELDESLIVRVQQPTENAMTVKPAAELISQTWNYTLTETNQIETFTYLAKTANENPLDSGTFFLDSSFNVAWHIRDSSGNAILHDSLNSNNFTTTRTTNILTLTIGETYTIRIRKGTPSGNVVIRMYAPNGTDDISGYTKVTDVLWFNAQQKIYTYTAARSGIYLLSTSFNVAWHIRDSFGNAILHDSWNSNNFTTTRSTNNVTMNEGETYTIRLQKGTPSGEYTFDINNN
ncbi:MAG: hypothetical protein FWH03_01730 [Firmicutes bacterium]|nr:hypothetical protein [Bacillota bacterium]